MNLCSCINIWVSLPFSYFDVYILFLGFRTLPFILPANRQCHCYFDAQCVQCVHTFIYSYTIMVSKCYSRLLNSISLNVVWKCVNCLKLYKHRSLNRKENVCVLFILFYFSFLYLQLFPFYYENQFFLFLTSIKANLFSITLLTIEQSHCSILGLDISENTLQFNSENKNKKFDFISNSTQIKNLSNFRYCFHWTISSNFFPFHTTNMLKSYPSFLRVVNLVLEEKQLTNFTLIFFSWFSFQSVIDNHIQKRVFCIPFLLFGILHYRLRCLKRLWLRLGWLEIVVFVLSMILNQIWSRFANFSFSSLIFPSDSSFVSSINMPLFQANQKKRKKFAWRKKKNWGKTKVMYWFTNIRILRSISFVWHR